MTVADPDFATAAQKAEARRTRIFTRINKANAWLTVFGLAWVTPILKAAAGDNPRAQLRDIWRLLGVPLLSIAVFVALWATLAPMVQTSLGAIPGPLDVVAEAASLHRDAMGKADKKAAFYA